MNSLCKQIFSVTDGLMVLLWKRDILAVGFRVLRKICFIEALVFEQIFRKASPTFGQKSLNVSFATPLSHPSAAEKIRLQRLFIIVFAVFICGCGRQKDIRQVTFSGTMELTEHVLGAKVAGRITTLNVDEGDIVKKVEILATLERYEQSKKDFERTNVLYQNGGANQQSLEYAQLTLEEQEVVSPIDGVVLVKDVETGEIVQAGAGVVVIGDPKDQWIKIYVSEDLVHQLRIGQEASIAVDGAKGPYKGHVSFISDKAEFTPRNIQTPEERVTQTIAVKITVDNPDENLHAGVSADVKF
jgi:multidrug efflux pump subunit AcrA (membrane-fusion protein)